MQLWCESPLQNRINIKSRTTRATEFIYYYTKSLDYRKKNIFCFRQTFSHPDHENSHQYCCLFIFNVCLIFTKYFFSSSEKSAGVSYTQDDVSFAVKQLLMKYLPSDHLAKLASKKENKDELDLIPKQNIGAIKSRPEFSFASVQYMKKYNLIANSQKGKNTVVTK